MESGSVIQVYVEMKAMQTASIHRWHRLSILYETPGLEQPISVVALYLVGYVSSFGVLNHAPIINCTYPRTGE